MSLEAVSLSARHVAPDGWFGTPEDGITIGEWNAYLAFGSNGLCSLSVPTLALPRELRLCHNLCRVHNIRFRCAAWYQVTLCFRLRGVRDDPRCPPKIWLRRRRRHTTYSMPTVNALEAVYWTSLTVVLVFRGTRERGDSTIHTLVRDLDCLKGVCRIYCIQVERWPRLFVHDRPFSRWFRCIQALFTYITDNRKWALSCCVWRPNDIT